MKKLLFLYLLLSFSCLAQEELIADKQFMLGCTNVGSTEEVTHYINAVGEVWQLSSGTFITGGVYSGSLVTVGNANFGSNDWPGFNFNWLLGEPYWSLGLYKVTNSKQTNKYFYIDARDNDFGSATYNPDFYIYFDNSSNIYKYRSTHESIDQGEVVRIWDIKGESPNTSGLQNYWSNVLCLVEADSPRLVWGPYPSEDLAVQSYKIYRAVTNNTIPPPTPNFSLLTTISSTTWEFTDFDYVVGGSLNLHYKVTAVVYDPELDITYETSASNTKITSGALYKSLNDQEKFSYTLSQNFPNPFNPSTTISLKIPEITFIRLNVYDILGNEIKELLNEVME